jgi:hypothetical protein
MEKWRLVWSYESGRPNQVHHDDGMGDRLHVFQCKPRDCSSDVAELVINRNFEAIALCLAHLTKSLKSGITSRNAVWSGQGWHVSINTKDGYNASDGTTVACGTWDEIASAVFGPE